MKRSLALSVTVLAAAAYAFSVPASAQLIELGSTKTKVVAPVCPPNVSQSNCKIILTRSTALETIRDSVAYPTTVTKAGQIVAFTVGLSALSTSRSTRLSDIKFLDHQYGGTTQVAITVLRQTGAKKLRDWKVVAESPMFHVQPWLGDVVQFPLATTLPVKKGDTIALTTPTWAPVLTIDLTTQDFAYRQSRRLNCTHPSGQSQAQLTVGQSARYGCDYPGTRVEYTATEITTPQTPKNYVHGRRRVHAARRPRVISR